MIAPGWVDAQHSIIRMDFTPPWTLEEFALARLRMFEMVEGLNYRLDLLNVAHPGEPPSGNLLDSFYKAMMELPRQFVMLVTVSSGGYGIDITEGVEHTAAFDAMPFKLCVADSLEKALAMIAADRADDGTRHT